MQQAILRGLGGWIVRRHVQVSVFTWSAGIFCCITRIASMRFNDLVKDRHCSLEGIHHQNLMHHVLLSPYETYIINNLITTSGLCGVKQTELFFIRGSDRIDDWLWQPAPGKARMAVDFCFGAVTVRTHSVLLTLVARPMELFGRTSHTLYVAMKCQSYRLLAAGIESFQNPWLALVFQFLWCSQGA